MKKLKVITLIEVEIDDVSIEELKEEEENTGYATPKNWQEIVKEYIKDVEIFDEHHPFYTADTKIKILAVID